MKIIKILVLYIFLILSCSDGNNKKRNTDIKDYKIEIGEIKFHIKDGRNYFIRDSLELFSVTFIDKRIKFDNFSMYIIKGEGILEYNKYNEGKVRVNPKIDSVHIALTMNIDTSSYFVGVFPINVEDK